MKKTTEGISVVICCYNSMERLPNTLLHLASQKVDGSFLWEVILVDNNSNDQIQELAILEWNKYNLNVRFRIPVEKNQGLSAARAKGFDTAEFDTLIFCDDDNWLEENYIQTAYELMKKDPGIGVLGGKNEVVSEAVLPNWFEKYQYAYAVGEQGSSEGEISSRAFVWGAGMVIRKNIWKKIQLLDYHSSLTDRTGISLSSGGDSELSLVSLLLGYKLWYSPKLRLKHFIAAERLSWAYLRNLHKSFGEAEVMLRPLKIINEMLPGSKAKQIRFSCRGEVISTMVTWLSHPKRTLKGILGKEGESAVLWLDYTFAYIVHLIKRRAILQDEFNKNYKTFNDHVKIN